MICKYLNQKVSAAVLTCVQWGVTPVVNLSLRLRVACATKQAKKLWNPGQTSPKVKNRGISVRAIFLSVNSNIDDYATHFFLPSGMGAAPILDDTKLNFVVKCKRLLNSRCVLLTPFRKYIKLKYLITIARTKNARLMARENSSKNLFISCDNDFLRNQLLSIFVLSL